MEIIKDYSNDKIKFFQSLTKTKDVLKIKTDIDLSKYSSHAYFVAVVDKEDNSLLVLLPSGNMEETNG